MVTGVGDASYGVNGQECLPTNRVRRVFSNSFVGIQRQVEGWKQLSGRTHRNTCPGKSTTTAGTSTSEYRTVVHRQNSVNRRSITSLPDGNCDVAGFAGCICPEISATKLNTQAFYKRVIKSSKSKRPKYQCLCANHNWLKRFERGEHRKPPSERVTERFIFFITEHDSYRLRKLCARSRLRVPVWLRHEILQSIAKYENRMLQPRKSRG
jgi:hypothetical protein